MTVPFAKRACTLAAAFIAVASKNGACALRMQEETNQENQDLSSPEQQHQGQQDQEQQDQDQHRQERVPQDLQPPQETVTEKSQKSESEPSQEEKVLSGPEETVTNKSQSLNVQVDEERRTSPLQSVHAAPEIIPDVVADVIPAEKVEVEEESESEVGKKEVEQNLVSEQESQTAEKERLEKERQRLEEKKKREDKVPLFLRNKGKNSITSQQSSSKVSQKGAKVQDVKKVPASKNAGKPPKAPVGGKKVTGAITARKAVQPIPDNLKRQADLMSKVRNANKKASLKVASEQSVDEESVNVSQGPLSPASNPPSDVSEGGRSVAAMPQKLKVGEKSAHQVGEKLPRNGVLLDKPPEFEESRNLFRKAVKKDQKQILEEVTELVEEEEQGPADFSMLTAEQLSQMRKRYHGTSSEVSGTQKGSSDIVSSDIVSRNCNLNRSSDCDLAGRPVILWQDHGGRWGHGGHFFTEILGVGKFHFGYEERGFSFDPSVVSERKELESLEKKKKRREMLEKKKKKESLVEKKELDQDGEKTEVKDDENTEVKDKKSTVDEERLKEKEDKVAEKINWVEHVKQGGELVEFHQFKLNTVDIRRALVERAIAACPSLKININVNAAKKTEKKGGKKNKTDDKNDKIMKAIAEKTLESQKKMNQIVTANAHWANGAWISLSELKGAWTKVKNAKAVGFEWMQAGEGIRGFHRFHHAYL
jgi:hypothetical protein